MLRDSYQSVLAAQSQHHFRDEIVRFAHELGFETVSATLIIDNPMTGAEFFGTDNTPAAYYDTYTNHSMGKLDPVMQHCKHHHRPIVWNQATYVQAGVGEIWEEQAAFGLRNGIAVAMHLPEGKHFFIGVDRCEALPKPSHEVNRLMADLQLFAVHAHEAASSIFTPLKSRDEKRPRLTPRELECLNWTMAGKTAWEVGAILGISERTAVLHLNNAMHKLGCNNKHQAVLKALRQGYIRC